MGFGDASAGVVGILRWPLLALLALVGFAFIYRYGPDRDRDGVRWFGWGVIIATITWLILSAGFSSYAAHFGDYNKTYGSLAAVVVLLMWFLLSTYVLLVGAEINSELESELIHN
jgi:membrane protein